MEIAGALPVDRNLPAIPALAAKAELSTRCASILHRHLERFRLMAISERVITRRLK
jgi:hypothetical protein